MVLRTSGTSVIALCVGHFPHSLLVCGIIDSVFYATQDRFLVLSAHDLRKIFMGKCYNLNMYAPAT